MRFTMGRELSPGMVHRGVEMTTDQVAVRRTPGCYDRSLRRTRGSLACAVCGTNGLRVDDCPRRPRVPPSPQFPMRVAVVIGPRSSMPMAFERAEERLFPVFQ